jgi:hypothetical protein
MIQVSSTRVDAAKPGGGSVGSLTSGLDQLLTVGKERKRAPQTFDRGTATRNALREALKSVASPEAQKKDRASDHFINAQTQLAASNTAATSALSTALQSIQQAQASAAAAAAGATGELEGNGKKVDLSHFTGSVPKWYKPELATWHGITGNVQALAALRQAYLDNPQLMKPVLAGAGGFRTYQQQVETKAAKGDLAATPGTSWHELGLAFDLNNSAVNSKVVAYLKKYKLYQLPSENWHFSYREVH